MAPIDITRPATGMETTHKNWLQPITSPNNEAERTAATHSVPARISTPRGRGRPRKTNPRDESAIEKRRAQVREAQRTYQKRKDTATATDKRRVEGLLQVLADLSSTVEALLQTASDTGVMQRDDVVSKRIQRLSSVYDTAMNNSVVQPALRIQQINNDRRLAGYHSHDINSTTIACESAPTTHIEPRQLFDTGALSLELVRVEETTVLQSFQSTSKYLAGRSILDVVKEKQQVLKDAERSSHGRRRT